MQEMFPIERDDEFYVFLKSSLPRRYRIEAEPSTSYYSEWMFHYKLYDGDVLLREFEGDYRTLENGTLVCEAMKLLKNLGIENRQC
jgi:hypothetical protein